MKNTIGRSVRKTLNNRIYRCNFFFFAAVCQIIRAGRNRSGYGGRPVLSEKQNSGRTETVQAAIDGTVHGETIKIVDG